MYTLVSPKAHIRKRVLSMGILQAAALTAFAFIPVFVKEQENIVYVFLGLSTLYWFFGQSAGPAWNVWITQLVSEPSRLKFFARRLQLTQTAVLCGFFGAGLVLHYGGSTHWHFAALFVAASLSRVYSVWMLSKHPKPQQNLVRYPILTDSELRQVKAKGALGIFIFVLATYGTVYIAAPFFTAYMLQEIKLTYLEFSIVTSSLVVARILLTPKIESMIGRIGLRAGLLIGSISVAFVPVLWLLSDNVLFLCCLQVVSGFGWGAMELALSLLVIETWPDDRRSKRLAWVNLAQTVAMAAGAFIGAELLVRPHAFFSTGYAEVFSISTVLRFVPVLVCAFAVTDREIRHKVVMRIVGIRPWGGLLLRPIFRAEKRAKKRV
jgi:MFS family permease